jgi:hypothetical protein
MARRPTSPEFTRQPVPVAWSIGIPSIDNAADRLQAEDSTRRAAAAAKVAAVQPKPNTSVYR